VTWHLKFRHRIGLLVVIAAAGLVAVTTVTLVLGRRSERELSGIETRYVPLLELSRDVNATFSRVTRALEDAANAAEPGPLAEADVVAGELRRRLREGHDTIADNGGDPVALNEEFGAYYGVARQVTDAIVAGVPADQLQDKIEAMRRAHHKLSSHLVVAIEPDRRRLAAAFVAARGSQHAALLIEAVVAVAVLVVMVMLSWRIIHRTVTSLHEVASGVKRLAQGDFGSQITVAAGDEVGDLASEANRTAARLREYRDGAERLLHETRQQAEQLRDAHGIAEAHNAALVSTQLQLERRAVELELVSATLRDKNADLENVSQTLSHDLRAPLRSIRGFAQILAMALEGTLDTDAAEALEHILQGSARMAVMLDDLYRLLRLSAAEATGLEIDPLAVLRDVTENLRSDLDQAGATITHDELPPIRGNAMLFGQILQNLIANAIKFHGPDQPALHVGVAVLSDVFQFSVQDNGIGIEPAARQRVFELFERLSNPRAGTGVGLALCKRAAEKLGGKIWVDGRVTSGTRIVFTIPRMWKPAAMESGHV
jgi:signal transduction histidine kinase